MVVPVLITNCHVLEKLKIGPLTAHIMTIKKATTKARELPVNAVILLAKRSKKLWFFLVMTDQLSLKKSSSQWLELFIYNLSFTLIQLRSSKACVSRFTKVSSPLRNQTRGS